MSVQPIQPPVARRLHETYNTILANIRDEAARRDGGFLENAKTVASEFVQTQVGDNRQILAYIIDQSKQGPHRAYSQYDHFDTIDGMGALKALAASCLVSDVMAN